MKSPSEESSKSRYENLTHIAVVVAIYLISKLLANILPYPENKNWLWIAVIPSLFLSWFFGWRKEDRNLPTLLWLGIPFLTIQLILQAIVGFGIADL